MGLSFGRVVGRRGARLGVVAGVAALGLAGSAQALPANCSESGLTVLCTFSYTGGAQSFTVPTGVSSVTVDALGAQGGAANVSGGLGGETEAPVSVSAGDVLDVLVGGQGGPFGGVGTPGFNGGGAGGLGGPGNPLSGAAAAGGGGASDVRTGACAKTLSCGLAARVLVGGGGGGSASGGGTDLQGGGGGNPTGGDGASGSAGGGGGGQSGGGSVGAAGSGDIFCFAPTAGTAGGTVTQDAGGAGGTGGNGDGETYGGAGGGGGGGGYWGGGGGGGGHCPEPFFGGGNDEPGAGGGGSSFGPAGATFTDSTRSGNGLVTISYTVPSAADLAATLVADSTGVGPGHALADKARAIQSAVNAGQTATACADITNYLGLVKAQTGKKLTGSQAVQLTSDAHNLAATLGC